MNASIELKQRESCFMCVASGGKACLFGFKVIAVISGKNLPQEPCPKPMTVEEFGLLSKTLTIYRKRDLIKC